MNYAVSLLKEIITKRKLIWDLGKADFRKRFVGSYFGIVWMFIQSIVTVVIYAVIFGIGFKSPPPVPGVSYVAWLVPGIVPWFFFSEALNTGTGCLQEYSYLVKKVVFKVEILPIIKLISCLLVHAFFVLIMADRQDAGASYLDPGSLLYLCSLCAGAGTGIFYSFCQCIF